MQLRLRVDLCLLDAAFVFATVCNRPPFASCVRGAMAVTLTFGGFKRRFMWQAWCLVTFQHVS